MSSNIEIMTIIYHWHLIVKKRVNWHIDLVFHHKEIRWKKPTLKFDFVCWPAVSSQSLKHRHPRPHAIMIKPSPDPKHLECSWFHRKLRFPLQTLLSPKGIPVYVLGSFPARWETEAWRTELVHMSLQVSEARVLVMTLSLRSVSFLSDLSQEKCRTGGGMCTLEVCHLHPIVLFFQLCRERSLSSCPSWKWASGGLAKLSDLWWQPLKPQMLVMVESGVAPGVLCGCKVWALRVHTRIHTQECWGQAAGAKAQDAFSECSSQWTFHASPSVSPLPEFQRPDVTQRLLFLPVVTAKGDTSTDFDLVFCFCLVTGK